MKRILYMAVPFAILLSGCTALMHTEVSEPNSQPVYTNNPPQSGYYDQQSGYANYDDSPQTDQVFYDELSPYGQWIDYPEYGYVWLPDVGYDFRPYATNGYWIYSDYGWTWVSNYSWGWAPFHYGRWFYDDSYGWMWQPGNEWAPAWVTWGAYDDYFCWAPIAPRVDIRYVSTRGGWTPPQNSWNVVPRRRITQVNINNYIVRTNTTAIRNVTIINNINNDNDRVAGSTVIRRPIYNRGPRLNDVENVTNTRVPQVRIRDDRRPGAQLISNNQLSVYRPPIKQNSPAGNAKPAPRKFNPFKPGFTPDRNPQNRPDQNQQPNQNPRPNNNQPQVQPNTRPDVNQNPQPNQNPRPNNNQPQVQPSTRPDVNQNPQPNQNPRPAVQPQQQNGRNTLQQIKPVRTPDKKVDTLKRIPNRQ